MPVNIQEILMTWGLKILYAAIILIVGFFVIKVLSKALEKAIEKSKIEVSVKIFLASLFRMTLKILLLVSVVATLGVPMTSFAALIGAAGLAVGLSLQGSLANFAGGIILLVLKPFVIGDYIEAAGYAGTVTGITIFYTYLNTFDNKAVIIPNGELSNNSIMNYSKNPTRRLDYEFGVAYDSNISKVKMVINEVLSRHPEILQDPLPQIRLGNMGDSSLDFKVRVWVNTADYWVIYFDIIEEVKEAFDASGIEIPYPHMVNIVKNQ
ncbi:MAG: mechanosensitive ion channel [Clostridiales bacterium]|nr:mechanosensitive ion channel [Clostridiales bacterium]